MYKPFVNKLHEKQAYTKCVKGLIEVLRLHAALTQDIHVSQAKQLSNLEHATISPMLTKSNRCP